MDPSIVVVHRSDTRRKACAGCVKAKRRCDLTLPACSRCINRNISCSYNDTKFAICEQANTVPPEPQITQIIPTWPIIPFTPPPEPIVELDLDMNLGYESIFSSPYASFPFPQLVVTDPFQIEYCVSELQRSIETLVLEGRTPFIHPDLYSDSMPDVYQDLLGVCSFYLQRTPQNYAMVIRMMDAKLKKLAEATKCIVKLGQWLLNVQALIMYQIIRLFDGDAQQRRNAEKDMKSLSAWTETLQAESSEAVRTTVAPSCNWIMFESVRRTLMVSWLLRGIFRSITDGVCDVVPLLARLLVSEDSEAWEGTPSTVENQKLVTYPDYVTRWNLGQVKKVNLYEMILLRACPDAIIEGLSRWGQLESRSRVSSC
ncbi:hypothetical protein VTL71DRAFT_2062 [Oculimacula yallundae]|uniref:Zn(2)-C6 fungal-type domain-containing protein n=1 Tax=Oculimacula yallundae TaxID=86028 RepID=A0ABR4C929_9HELO